MTAPHTKVTILFTGTALVFNSLRDTHTNADYVHRDSVFVYDTHKHCRFCAQGLFFPYYYTRCTELQILSTGTALLLTSLRGCIRFF
jgi:hypothetical protein